MKKLYSIVLLLLLVSCNDVKEPFEGYIVGKEYMAEHMCHSEYEHTIEASVGYHHVPHMHHTPHHHRKVEAVYVIYVANIHEVRRIRVSRAYFSNCSLLDKVTINK